MFDDVESTITFVVAILIAYGVILWLGVVVWAYRDISERTRDGASQAMAVLITVLFNIPGLFLYLLLRPSETLIEAHERRLQNEALAHDLVEQRRACPSCQRSVRDDFVFCPHCRTKLQEPCTSCGRSLEPSWIACANCGAQTSQPVSSTASRPARAPAATNAPAPPVLPEAEAAAPPRAQATEEPEPKTDGRSSKRRKSAAS